MTHFRTISANYMGLAIVSIGFVFAYAFDPSIYSPSGSIVWHTWADQGEYLKSAVAFSHLNFAPTLHHYPPLYAMLAAPFVAISPNDPFVVVNFASTVVSAWILIALFSRDVSPAVATIAATVLLINPTMIHIFVVPWTSTIELPLVLASALILQRGELDKRTSATSTFLLSLFIGLIIADRPIDGVLASTLLPFWAWVLLRNGDIKKHWKRHALAFIAGYSIGPAIFALSNLIIFKTLFSPYTTINKNVFLFADIPEKLVSLLLDSQTLYFDPGQALLTKMPWMLPALASAVVCCVFGRVWHKAIAIAAFSCIAVYASFDDLLPNGLFRYLNFHYLRWSILLCSMMVLSAAAIFLNAKTRPRFLIAVIVCLAFAASGIHLTKQERLEIAKPEKTGLSADLPAPMFMDYIDIRPTTGFWQETYFSEPTVLIDNVPFTRSQSVRHLKVIPSSVFPQPLGSGPGVNDVVRILFFRPRFGQHVDLRLDGLAFKVAPGAELVFGSYGFGYGIPRWARYIRPRGMLSLNGSKDVRAAFC